MIKLQMKATVFLVSFTFPPISLDLILHSSFIFFFFLFQFEVSVCDQAPGADQLCAVTNAQVTVNIIRNRYPFFINEPYDRNLANSFTVGATVVTVDGRDPDPAVSGFCINFLCWDFGICIPFLYCFPVKGF